MIFSLRFFISFIISFIILSFPVKNSNLFEMIYPKTAPITNNVYGAIGDMGKNVASKTGQFILGVFNNSEIPELIENSESIQDAVQLTSSAIKRDERKAPHFEEITPEEEALLLKILSQ